MGPVIDLEHYRKVTKYPASVPYKGPDGRVYGIWFLGQDYKGSGFHGSYPPGYLERIRQLIPGKHRTLHLFCGKIPPGDYTRFDLMPDREPDVLGDAHNLSSYFEPKSFDLIIADPPYTGEDADKYGTPMVNRNKVLRECATLLRGNGLLVWLDQVMPMYRNEDYDIAGVIGVFRSTNHRFRCVCIFRRREGIFNL